MLLVGVPEVSAGTGLNTAVSQVWRGQAAGRLRALKELFSV